MMNSCERKMLKCNAEAVDAVFRMMFETFWVVPYDRRRGHPALIAFEHAARQAALLLSSTDPAAASAAQLRRLEESLTTLTRRIEGLAASDLFSEAECARALLLCRRISDELTAARCVGTPHR